MKKRIGSLLLAVLMALCFSATVMAAELTDEVADFEESSQLVENEAVAEETDESVLVAQPMAAGYYRISGELLSRDDVNTYDITLDFSNTNSITFWFLQTGYSFARASIYDENGELVTTMDAGHRDVWFGSIKSGYWPKRDFTMTKPDANQDIYQYTVVVFMQADDVFSKANTYVLNYGDTVYASWMISGRENMVAMEPYLGFPETGNMGVQGNTMQLLNSPSMLEEHWYQYVPDSNITTLTLSTHSTNRSWLQFRVIDATTEEDVYDSVYDPDSNRDNTMDTTGLYNHITKAKLNLTIGRNYYIVVYNIDDGYCVPYDNRYAFYVGQPQYTGPINERFYSTSSVTAAAGKTSATRTISVTTLPATAVVVKATFAVNDGSGVMSHMLKGYETIAPGASSWVRNTYYGSNGAGQCDWPTPSQPRYYMANGTWQIRFTAASSSVTCKPGINITYFYEFGD